MFIMDVDNLTVIQQERYSEFVRQAELRRLVRTQQVPDNASQPAARPHLLAALQQMVSMALQSNVRAARPQ